MTIFNYRALLSMGCLATLLSLSGCGGGNDSSSRDAAIAATIVAAQAEAQANAPAKVYTFSNGEGVHYNHHFFREILVKAGIQVAAVECRAVEEGGWDPDFPKPTLFPNDGAGAGGGPASGPYMYFVAEIRARDVPAAKELGFPSPPSERVLRSTVVPCVELEDWMKTSGNQ